MPSIRSLEVLWGHTEFVGQRRLTDIKKTDVADNSLKIDREEVTDREEITTGDVFISHSFKDYDDVIKIGKFLQKEGVKP